MNTQYIYVAQVVDTMETQRHDTYEQAVAWLDERKLEVESEYYDLGIWLGNNCAIVRFEPGAFEHLKGADV